MVNVTTWGQDWCTRQPLIPKSNFENNIFFLSFILVHIVGNWKEGTGDYVWGLETKFTMLCTLLKINITYTGGLVASHVQKTNMLNQSITTKIRRTSSFKGSLMRVLLQEKNSWKAVGLGQLWHLHFLRRVTSVSHTIWTIFKSKMHFGALNIENQAYFK